ncbi:MAG: autoinducer binding domain-containing protein [Magnetococcales bacterium]|nr:autoinducer binding domain-containing protein [Magnetococcales bacterium]
MPGNNRTNRLMENIESLRNSKDSDDLWERMLGVLGQYGIQGLLYTASHLPTIGTVSDFADNALVRTNYDPEFMAEKMKQLDEDPFFDHALSQTESLLWDDASFSTYRGELSKEEKACVDLDWDFGLVTGVNIPFQFENGRGGGAFGLHAPDMSWEEFRKIWGEHDDILTQTVLSYDICLRERFIGSVYSLSPREKECLLWLAAGLVPKQIAYRLGLHPKTVENQISSARKKLNASTSAQAVSKALILGVISP